MSSGPDDPVTVRWCALPLDLHDRLQAHVDGLVREFRLLSEQADGPRVPRRLLELVQEVTERYAAAGEAGDAQVDAAMARGERSTEVVLEVPASAGPACTALLGALVEADAWCAEGTSLLLLATPPELAAYRDWYLGEVVAQIAGRPPVPWPARATPGTLDG